MSLEENPDHKWAKLLAVTEVRQVAYAEVDQRQIARAKELSASVESKVPFSALQGLQQMTAHIEWPAK